MSLKVENNKRNSPRAALFQTLKIVLPFVFGAICLYYIFIGFDWAEIGATLAKADLWFFLLSSVAATVLFWILRALRFRVLLPASQSNVSFFKLYLYTAIAIGLANFTPLGAAEAFKVELLRQHGVERLSGYAFFLVEKLLDLIALLLLALLGAWILLERSRAPQLFLIGGAAAAVLTAAAAVFFNSKIRRKIGFLQDLTQPSGKNLLIALFLTAASWATLAAGWKCVFKSVYVNLTMVETCSVMALTTVVSMISLVPGAIGIHEISIAVLLKQLGYTAAQAETAAIAIGIYSLVILGLAAIHLAILKAANLIGKPIFRRAAP